MMLSSIRDRWPGSICQLGLLTHAVYCFQPDPLLQLQENATRHFDTAVRSIQPALVHALLQRPPGEAQHIVQLHRRVIEQQLLLLQQYRQQVVDEWRIACYDQAIPQLEQLLANIQTCWPEWYDRRAGTRTGFLEWTLGVKETGLLISHLVQQKMLKGTLQQIMEIICSISHFPLTHHPSAEYMLSYYNRTDKAGRERLRTCYEKILKVIDHSR